MRAFVYAMLLCAAVFAHSAGMDLAATGCVGLLLGSVAESAVRL